ncbi:thioredoxin-like protein [Lyophyllum atratum]|nr:thioredoxin-like protein [Lyophyllum atratum]
MTVKELVDSTIQNKKVAIFSKSWCPYCKKAKAVFDREFPDVEKEIIELDERDDGDAIQAYLLEKTGQRTVPNVFVDGEHIGGNDDVQAGWKSGRLTKLIRT